MKLRALFVSFVLVTAVLVLGGATARAEPACSITHQLTDSTGGAIPDIPPAISDDGNQVVLASDRNLVGANADLNREIYLIDVSSGVITQLTSTTGGANDAPALSGDGTRVAFQSNRDIGGGNADLNNEIFLIDFAGPTTTQLTSTTGGGNARPAIDEDGNRVAYEATADPLGTNPDGSNEIFVLDTTGPTVTQLTARPTTDEASSTVSIDDTGTLVAFEAEADHVSANSDLNSEIFVVDTTGPATSQLTVTTAGDSRRPQLSDDGTTVVFESDRNLTGGNADGSTEVFSRTFSPAVTTQVTSGNFVNSQGPGVDADGDRIGFQSNANPTGHNADGGLEIFALDTGSAGIGQATQIDTPGVMRGPRLSDDGRRMVFASIRNHLGGNPDGSLEVYVALCGGPGPTYTDVDPANPFYDEIEWMAEAEIASGFPNGTFKPQDPVKRQQMANFLYNLAGQPPFLPPVTPTFVDVPAGNPFFLPVEWMVDEGIASGFPNGTFKPQDPVKRQQMANFLNNLAGQPAFTPGSPTFVDVPAGNTFFAQIEWMADEQIASGFPNGTFKPQDPVKRQQMANFLHNLALSPGVGI